MNELERLIEKNRIAREKESNPLVQLKRLALLNSQVKELSEKLEGELGVLQEELLYAEIVKDCAVEEVDGRKYLRWYSISCGELFDDCDYVQKPLGIFDDEDGGEIVYRFYKTENPTEFVLVRTNDLQSKLIEAKKGDKQ